MIHACDSADAAELRCRVAALQRIVDDLSQSNAELEQFAHVVSHDLREPLRMIVSYAQLMQRRYGGRLDEDADSFLGFITDGAHRMDRLIEDILEFSRAGRSPLSPTEIDAALPLHEALADLGQAIDEVLAHVSVAALPKVLADPMQLERLFANLIGNAIKYRSPERAVEISVGAVECADGWHFTIADNGQGIPATECETVFGAFARLHGRDVPGTGLGLAICRKIVERHGGTIWAEPNQPHGTAFHFTLPAPDRP